MKRKKLRLSGLADGNIFGKESSVFLLGDREVTVCGCEKVVSYAPDRVQVKLCDGTVEVCGCGLTLSSCFGEEIKLSGVVNDIKISGDGCDGKAT